MKVSSNELLSRMDLFLLQMETAEPDWEIAGLFGKIKTYYVTGILQEGMVFALEPKKGVPGVGMVDIENTFRVTPAGGECLTGESLGLIPV